MGGVSSEWCTSSVSRSGKMVLREYESRLSSRMRIVREIIAVVKNDGSGRRGRGTVGPEEELISQAAGASSRSRLTQKCSWILLGQLLRGDG